MGVVPVAIFKPSGSRDQAGAISVSKSGAVWDTTLDGAPAWRVLEGTTNLCPDPNMETIANWGVNTAGTTVSKDTSNPAAITAGPTAIKVVCDGASTTDGIAPNAGAGAAVTNGQTYTISFDLTGAVGGEQVAITQSLHDSGGAGLGDVRGPTITLTTTPTRYSYTFTVSNASAVSVRPKVLAVAATAKTFWADACQIEQKSYATPFVPAKDANGILLPGQAWNGPPDASTSTRTAGSASLSVVPPVDAGSMVVRARWPYAPVGTTAARVLHFGATNGAVGIGRSSGGAYLGFVTGQYSISTSNNQPPGTTKTLAIMWQGRTYSFWDGTTKIGEAVSGVDINVGFSNWLMSLNGAGVVDSAFGAIYPRPLTAAELAKLDATPTALLGWDTLADRVSGILEVGRPGLSILEVGRNPLSLIGGS